MKKKINRHPAPEVYRIIMRCGSWVTKSERYFSAFHSSEALEDIYHTFHRGKIHAKSLIIYDIQEYDRYSNLWVSRFDKALDNIETIDIKTLDVRSNKIVLKRG